MARLTRERIVIEALALLDEVGADALTMRKLAERLGVQAGALYWHFPGKQKLLAGLAEAMLAGAAVDGPVDPERWKQRVLDQMLGFRRALLAHRDSGRVFAGTFAAEPNTLAFGESLVSALRIAGLRKREAAWSATTLVDFVLGFVIEEQAAADADVSEFLDRLDRDKHPRLTEVASAFVSDDYEARFRFGVRLILAGVEQALVRA